MSKKKIVLYIDDNVELLYLMSAILRAVDCDVTECDNGLEAIKLIRKNYYDVIMCDIVMPGITGYSILQEFNDIKKEKKLKTKFGFVTGKTTKPDRVTGLTMGVDFYLEKPFKVNEVINLLNYLIHDQKAIMFW